MSVRSGFTSGHTRARAALAAFGLAALLVGWPEAAHAHDVPDESFALTIGVNRAIDADVLPLRFADDDAARSFDLLRAVGTPTWIVARLDENTARLHGDAFAKAKEPTLASLRHAVGELRDAVAKAHARGAKTSVYVFYAGHGAVRNGEGYITLEDARLTGSDLVKEITNPIDSDRYHVVLDACAAQAVAFGRGPGGSRRSSENLTELSRLKDDPRVGLLLATTASAETHEWDALSAGVFSHEVRSGLFGAADADGDGLITYREMVAFVRQANAAIPNERFRPAVIARPPAGSEVLFDIGHAPVGKVVIEGATAGRYIVEDPLGVRLADLNTAPKQRAALLRTSARGFFVRSPNGDNETFVPAGSDTLALSAFRQSDRHVESRGAAHESFARLFAAPFDVAAVPGTPYTLYDPTPEPPPAKTSTRTIVGYATLGTGVASLLTGGVLSIAAGRVRNNTSTTPSQAEAADRNHTISTLNSAAIVTAVAGGALSVTGATLLLWPIEKPNGDGEFVGAAAGVRGTF